MELLGSYRLVISVDWRIVLFHLFRNGVVMQVLPMDAVGYTVLSPSISPIDEAVSNKASPMGKLMGLEETVT